jgi:hypothetical protein
MRPALLAVPLLLASLVPRTSTAAASASRVTDTAVKACAAPALLALGWRLELVPEGTTTIHAGQPCDRAGLAEAQAAGDLRITLAATAEPEAEAELLAGLLADPASHCAFSFQLGNATRRAVDRLVQNRDFRFSSLQLGWIGFGFGGAERDGWTAIRSFGRGFQPARAPSQAIEGFYRGSVRAECGVGRQIAQYATQYELHGAEGFDRSFAPEEIVIGTFRQLHGTRSVLLGASAGEFARDGRAVAASAMGRHVFGPESLDDVDNQAENFVVYDVSPRAAQALRAAGGFEAFNRQARKLWELSRTLDLVSRGSYERLLFERDAALLARLAPRKRRVVERMQAILDDPFFQGFDIYVHPKGVKPVAYHFARLLDLNPRTPFRIELGLHNLHTTMYRRWLAPHLADCAGAEPLSVEGALDERDTSARR